MDKQSHIEDPRKEENPTVSALMPNNSVPTVSGDWGGMMPIYNSSMEDHYAEKSASAKEAGVLSDLLTKLKTWWDDKKKLRADVSEDKPEAKQASFEDPAENAYWDGFVEKCAQVDVNPADLVQIYVKMTGRG
jgi:hypothetical protein